MFANTNVWIKVVSSERGLKVLMLMRECYYDSNREVWLLSCDGHFIDTFNCITGLVWFAPQLSPLLYCAKQESDLKREPSLKWYSVSSL